MKSLWNTIETSIVIGNAVKNICKQFRILQSLGKVAAVIWVLDLNLAKLVRDFIKTGFGETNQCVLLGQNLMFLHMVVDVFIIVTSHPATALTNIHPVSRAIWTLKLDAKLLHEEPRLIGNQMRRLTAAMLLTTSGIVGCIVPSIKCGQCRTLDTSSNAGELPRSIKDCLMRWLQSLEPPNTKK